MPKRYEPSAWESILPFLGSVSDSMLRYRQLQASNQIDRDRLALEERRLNEMTQQTRADQPVAWGDLFTASPLTEDQMQASTQPQQFAPADVAARAASLGLDPTEQTDLFPGEETFTPPPNYSVPEEYSGSPWGRFVEKVTGEAFPFNPEASSDQVLKFISEARPIHQEAVHGDEVRRTSAFSDQLARDLIPINEASNIREINARRDADIDIEGLRHKNTLSLYDKYGAPGTRDGNGSYDKDIREIPTDAISLALKVTGESSTALTGMVDDATRLSQQSVARRKGVFTSAEVYLPQAASAAIATGNPFPATVLAASLSSLLDPSDQEDVELLQALDEEAMKYGLGKLFTGGAFGDSTGVPSAAGGAQNTLPSGDPYQQRIDQIKAAKKGTPKNPLSNQEDIDSLGIPWERLLGRK